MKTITRALAVLLVSASSALAAADTRVPGEKLDSGLGEFVYGESLDSGLGEFVYGESLDNGLGELGTNYTGHEFVRVPGESLDSGLGSLTRQDVMKFVPAKSTLSASVDR
jgi:hypothetical protein